MAYTFASGRIASVMTGLGISSLVFFILTAQVWYYFRRVTLQCQESRGTKVLVALVWLTQLAGMALTSWMASGHKMEFQDVTHFAGHMSKKFAMYLGICSLTTSLVHGVFIYRVYGLEKRIYGKPRISFILIALCVSGQAFGLFSTFCAFGVNFTMVNWAIPVSLGCSAINDILTAGTLIYILHKNKTESRRTNQIVTKLIIFSFQTGMATTMVALIAIGIWAACTFEYEHLCMCFPMGGLYATCLLANLIARESYLQPKIIDESGVSTLIFTHFTQKGDLCSSASTQDKCMSVIEGGAGSDDSLPNSYSK